jgi:sulfatase maturation enzyme AslB (radical SAM superfamily)
MLAWDNIKFILEYLNWKKEVTVNQFCITTNGTILPEDFKYIMNKYPNLYWAASLDGNKFMNSLRVFKDGKNTYDVVMENFNYIKENLGSHRAGIHMITHPYNIGYLSEGIDHLYNKGVRSIGIGTVESTIEIGKEYCDRYIKELDKVSRNINNDKYLGLHIDVLEFLKPKSDSRHYIKDENGKIVGESYGRSGEDITKKKTKYNSYEVTSPLGKMIYDIREIVYQNHQKRLKDE